VTTEKTAPTDGAAPAADAAQGAPVRTLTVSQQWNRDQIDLLKATVAEGTTDLEFQLFAQVCQRTGLDPFARQIYAIKRKQLKDGQWVERMVLQTGIDGYRVIAERTNEYVGGDEPTYGSECPCGSEKLGKHPEWAAVTVRRLKAGQGWTTTAKAYFDEYVQTTREGKPNAMWSRMPRNQLAKCAEALALRRAFPGLFEGVYTAEEMAQADNEPHAPDAAKVTVVDAPPARRTAPTSTGRSAPPATPTAAAALTGDRGAAIAAGECPECQRRLLTAYSGRAVTFALPRGGGNIKICTGWDPLGDDGKGAYVKHPMTEPAQVLPLAAGRREVDDVDPEAVPF